MKILVTGGRTYAGAQRLSDVLDLIHAIIPITSVVHGDAFGADALAKQWAIMHNIPHIPYPALWDDISIPGAVPRRSRSGKLYNAIAGPQRNQRMIDDNPDIAFTIAFDGGTGTADMMRRSKAAKIPTIDTAKKIPKLKVSQIWKKINQELIEIIKISGDSVMYRNLTTTYVNKCSIDDLYLGIIYHLYRAAI